MALRYNKHSYANVGNQITTATTTVLFGPIDISTFENFSLLVQNQHSAVDVIGLRVEVAFDPSATVSATGATNWMPLSTATFPLANSATAFAISFTPTPYTNAFNWLRILGGYSATAISSLRATIGGFTRR